MTALLAKIHVAKKQLAMTDDDYRAVLMRVTGKDSAKACSQPELLRAVAEFERLGFRGKPARKDRPRHVKHIYALWGELQRLRAVVQGPAGAKALRAFVTRQTGVSAPEFLSAAQASPVTEALKSWIARVKQEHVKKERG